MWWMYFHHTPGKLLSLTFPCPPKLWHLGLWEGYEKARHMWGFCIHSWFLILSLAKDKTLSSSPPFHFQKEQFPSAAAQTLFLCSQPWHCYGVTTAISATTKCFTLTLMQPLIFPPTAKPISQNSNIHTGRPLGRDWPFILYSWLISAFLFISLWTVFCPSVGSNYLVLLLIHSDYLWEGRRRRC